MVAALGLGILELAAPGYIFLGFAGGAATIALLLLTGGPLAAALAASAPLMILAFAVSSLLIWIALRKVLGVRKGQERIWTRDINED
ncbi:MAG: hypothetical protein ACPGID_12870 [Rubricella sp.]